MSKVSTKTGPAARRLLTALIVCGVIAGFVAFLYQRPIAQWGSTRSEREGRVVGDRLVASADISWTRAITIDATPAQVWPWLVQMGENRAGFYNFDWGEQLFADPIHNATTVHPEWQELRAGDVIHPKPGGDWTVVVLEPNRALVLDNPLARPTDWTWATELRPLDGDRTRLVTRIRGHKGSFFSYTLDAPDLVLFPRLLTGIKQRAEGTLPGLPGTHTGRPFPLARLPVHWWAALAWLAGLGFAGSLLAGPMGLGRWGRRRPHPWITLAGGFVVGAGYLLMSDTPPWHFLSHVWALGLVAGIATGVLATKYRPTRADEESDRAARWFPRMMSAVVETGVFVVVPITAVWQAATAEGWTGSIAGRALVSITAAVVGTGIAWLAWSRAAHANARWTLGAAFAITYAVTGSGMSALLAAVIYESARRREAPPPVTAALADERELVVAR